VTAGQVTDLAPQLSGMRVRASTPDGRLTAELVGRSELLLSFDGSYYYRTDERDLETQGATLCRLLWAGYVREFTRIIADAGGTAVDPHAAGDPKDIEYFQRLSTLTAHGDCGDGHLELTANGMRNFDVRISDGTLGLLSEEQFTQCASRATQRLIDDQLDQVLRMRMRLYHGAGEE
jgi:hypothetical protein